MEVTRYVSYEETWGHSMCQGCPGYPNSLGVQGSICFESYGEHQTRLKASSIG